MATTSYNENERNFTTFDVSKETGKKATANEPLRDKTFLDTEAKLFENLEREWYNGNKEINMLSERGMCDSCKNVAEQFMKAHPDVNVNVVSGLDNTGQPWKGRKPYD